MLYYSFPQVLKKINGNLSMKLRKALDWEPQAQDLEIRYERTCIPLIKFRVKQFHFLWHLIGSFVD